CNSYANQTVWYRVTSVSATTYVIITNSDSCGVGTVIWPAAGLPLDFCTMIDCQSSAFGPSTTVFRITGSVGISYAIQLTYNAGSPCSMAASFTIRAATTYSGNISNPGPLNSCSAPLSGCYFTSTPNISQITATCTSYPLTSDTNLVNDQFFSFTTASTDA